MATEDKAENHGQNLAGKGKEALGKVTGNESLEAEGKADQTGANLKNAGENVKDAFK
ncbi:CsbD family protein [Marisediminicola sp. LYQ134]|uniref:CsbD family protein n=1 Tax=unclassified Marisediminicola TaxID=2618316 RepID=UPI0039838C87